METLSFTTAAILLLGFSCISAEFSGKAMDNAKKVDSTCRAQVGGAEKGYITKFLRGDVDADDLPRYKCYVKCVMVELDSLSHDGVYNVDAEKENVPPEILDEGHRILHKCKDTKGADPCDTAYQIHKCYHDENPELYRRVLHHWDAIAMTD
nr:odorant binding protein 7 [Coptotermes formosanus]